MTIRRKVFKRPLSPQHHCVFAPLVTATERNTEP